MAERRVPAIVSETKGKSSPILRYIPDSVGGEEARKRRVERRGGKEREREIRWRVTRRSYPRRTVEFAGGSSTKLSLIPG